MVPGVESIGITNIDSLRRYCKRFVRKYRLATYLDTDDLMQEVLMARLQDKNIKAKFAIFRALRPTFPIRGRIVKHTEFKEDFMGKVDYTNNIINYLDISRAMQRIENKDVVTALKMLMAGYDYNEIGAAACVVTWTGHGMESGQYVTFAGITQADWTALNARHAITYISPDSFSIAVDTSGYAGDYVAGTDSGTVVHSDWTTLDTQSAQYLLSSTLKDYLIATPASYRYYKLTVTAGLGATLQLAELALQLSDNYLQVLGIATGIHQLDFNPNSLEIGAV
jgi:hypothetical protein